MLKEFSLRSAIEERHGGKVTLNDGTKLEAGCYFRLVISVEETTFSMDLSVALPVTGIEIDPPWILF